MALINADREAKGLEPIKDTRQLLTEYVLERVTAGLISNRDDIIELFQSELGLSITRKGFDYITVLDPDTDKRYRLKGKLYEREFRPQPEVTAEIRSGTSTSSRFDGKELRQVRARIRSNYQYRYRYHQERYAASTVNSDKDRRQVLVDSSGSGIEPNSGDLLRRLGNDFILVESDRIETEDVGLPGREDRFSRDRDKTATTDFRKDTGVNSRDNNYADRQRDVSDSAPWLDPKSWLAMPGKTLYEAGVDNERTGKQINERFVKASRAVQAGHDELVPQIQHGHEAVREAEQAASYSSDAFELTSSGLERANREAIRIQQQTDFHLSSVRRSLNKKRVKQLERFKTEINLVKYATSIGYKYLRDESSPSSAVLRHDAGDKILVVTDTDGQGIYFSLNDDRDRGTIIDLVQRRRDLNLGEVRKELRPWLVDSDCAPRSGKANRSNYNIAKPEPTNRDKINECLMRLKQIHQSPTQPDKPSPRPKKRRQLEL
ncbi:MAG: hypothetical protein QNJ53_03325 [Pleurocapsa sp. MO_192.B19]|nr:hypothetical protein [Pleurocapsa sp. MO_192.B19]